MGDVYYKLDKKSREELISTVKRVAIEILEGPQENWITYSYLLPRKRVEVMDKNGITTRSRWYYSRNRILRMVRENDILRFDDIIDRD